ncbi:MAG: UDP-N-acetylmuramoyl-L-alanine--D-glutamate ligase [Patescibacteria group bacterium]|nr:UDP-N-acetylmuramoyl-L-alanine--D-glutamate ligase [Patescibacteria group bacterium]MDD5164525.1 UDP-N-acetylmuramoyl-L-alanine--D-glutamate ligase [Patescibacteria group bacterium]MDD5534733.1 UDP-N-acetylmuramoyl-L-alanine--D-glutamate ligase [Patescibacteria group bacterium]
MNLNGKKVLVMGLGIIGGGLETVRWLLKQGAKITITDLRTEKELKPSLEKLKNFSIKYILGKHRPQDFKSADLIIKNPAVRNSSPFLKIAQDNQVPITTDINLFFELYPGQIIGITGTKGKSTTTTLIYQILKKSRQKVNLGGNIGFSPLKFLNNKTKKDSKMILELSSFHLENLKKGPEIAVITNLFPDHLDRYKTFKKYIEAKKIILKRQSKKGIAILNYDNKKSYQLNSYCRGKVYWFSKKPFSKKDGVFLKNQEIYFRQNNQLEKICSVARIKILGEHNLENILAAVCVAAILKIKPQMIQKFLNDFSGIANRLELVRIFKGVKYYNDTAATMPEAAISALKSFNQPVILICGGADKNLKFQEFAQYIKKYGKIIILLPGTATPRLKSQILSAKSEKKIFEVKNMKEAIEMSQKNAKKGDIVLLSPGCASFGLFKNEFDRGGKFKKFVKNLK